MDRADFERWHCFHASTIFPKCFFGVRTLRSFKKQFPSFSSSGDFKYMMADVFLWLAPLLVLPASWVFYKVIPFRKQRYCIYAVALVAAFTLDLFHVSFSNGMVNTGSRMFVCFMVAELFWNIGRLAKGKLLTVLAIVALCLYGAYFHRWIAAGPAKGRELWAPVVASSFKVDNIEYRVIDSDRFDRRRPSREITLVKQTGRFPLEKLINAYRTPEGYYKTAITYKWSISPLGVRLDLCDKNNKLRTMGEGF